MESDEVMPILQFIYDNTNNFKKWKSFFAVPFHFGDNYNQLKTYFEDFPNIPLTTINGDFINFSGLIHTLVSMSKNQSIIISISPLLCFEHNIIGLKIYTGNKYNKITIDKIKIILSAITNQDITISDSQSQDFEGIIKVENGDELSVFSFDFDTFTLNGYSSTSQEKNETYSISFLAKSNFLEDFYLFANECMIHMAYYPSESLNISLGSNSILLNIPKTQNRFVDLAEYLFPQSVKHVYSHTEKSEELNAISTVTLIYFVVPTNSTSTTNKITQNKITKESEGSQRNNNNNQFDSIFMFFTFINGIPQESNSHMSLELLSSIAWSDLSISFIPMPICSGKNESEPINNHKNDDFITNLYNARKIPYCTFSSIVEKPRTVIMAFLNTTKESAQALSRIALYKSFEKIQNLYTKKKNYVRLNRIWESIDTISTSLSKICDDESLYREAWNGCCSVLSQYKKKLKIAQKVDEKDLEDDFLDQNSDRETLDQRNDENHMIDQDVEETEIIDLSNVNEITNQNSKNSIVYQDSSEDDKIDHDIEETEIIDLGDEDEIPDQKTERNITYQESSEDDKVDQDIEATETINLSNEDKVTNQEKITSYQNSSEDEEIDQYIEPTKIIDLGDEDKITIQNREKIATYQNSSEDEEIDQYIEPAQIIDLSDENDMKEQEIDEEREVMIQENDENEIVDLESELNKIKERENYEKEKEMDHEDELESMMFF